MLQNSVAKFYCHVNYYGHPVKNRLRGERERLEFSQAGLARALAISRETIRLYETGEIAPGSEVLARMASLGFYVQYILTGTYSKNLDRVAEDAGIYKAGKGAGALSREEEVLVDKYRHLKPGDRTRAQALVDVLASAGVKKDKTG